MDTIILHALALLAAAMPFTVLERRWAARSDERWWRRPLGIDLTYWFVGPLLNQVALLVALVLIGLGLLLVLGDGLDRTLVERIQHGRGVVSTWPLWLQGVAAFVLADFTLYWIHRAFHRVPVLWHLHAIHHSPSRIDWLAAVRNHPLGTMISSVVLGTVLIAVGFAPTVLVGVLPLIGLLALLGHANVRWEFGPLRLLIASPVFHRWHHTDVDEGGDRNFASFLPLWDRLFGTWYLPLDRPPERFGIAGDPVPHRFLGQLWYPLRRWGEGLGRLAATRTRRVLLGLTLALVLLCGAAATLPPLATLVMQVALPRQIDDLHVERYRRQGAAVAMAALGSSEHVRVLLPRDEAYRWFMAVAGHGLPPQVAEADSCLEGEARHAALDGPLPLLVASIPADRTTELHGVLGAARVNAWLRRGAERDGSPWVLQLDAGSRLAEDGEPPPAGFDRTLLLTATGMAARRDGRPGLLRIARLTARLDLRWRSSAERTTITPRLRLDDLTLHDLRLDQPLELPRLVWHLIVAQVNHGLARQPLDLPFAVSPTTMITLALR